MKPIISVEGLGKKYQIKHKAGRGGYRSLRDEFLQLPSRIFTGKESCEEFWALRDVSFNVMPGERIGIIGRNGAGKSTLLKLLSRITEPSSGTFKMRGRVASLLEVGTGFHPELTGRENIFLNGAILGMSRTEVVAKFDEIVDFAGVEKFLDTPVKRYSSGMYVRLAFAVAAHLEPEILVVDEVLAVGDAEFQKKCLGKMQEVSSGEGRTVLFVSHNMGAIRQLCDRGIILDGGVCTFVGDIEDSIVTYSKSESFNGIEILEDSNDLVIQGVEIDSVVAHDATLAFSICFESKRDLENCYCDFAIFNKKRHRVAHHVGRFTGSSMSIDKGMFKLEFSVERLSLVNGEYSISLYFTDNVGNFKYFSAHNVAFFEVVGAFPYSHKASIVSLGMAVKKL